jgi:hypothetical protein
VNVFVPAVNPLIAYVRDAVVCTFAALRAAPYVDSKVLPVIVVAPEIASVMYEATEVEFIKLTLIVTSAVVPVVSVTDGLVPPLVKVGVKLEVSVVVPPVTVNAETSVTHTHDEPL